MSTGTEFTFRKLHASLNYFQTYFPLLQKELANQRLVPIGGTSNHRVMSINDVTTREICSHLIPTLYALCIVTAGKICQSDHFFSIED